MKQTKKIVVLLMFLCLMLSCIFAFASCGDDTCSHSETEWVVVKEATATEDGQKNEVCKYCDEILSTEKIPATGSATKPESFCFWLCDINLVALPRSEAIK